MKNIKKILFVCHGNICRSPMAEFIMKNISSRDIHIESAATSNEEIGNHIYPPARNKLKEKGIPFDNNKIARQITINDYHNYDMIIAMEKYNIRNILRIVKNDPLGKISLLMDYTSLPRDVTDPWYTGDFEKAFQDIQEGCYGLLKFLTNEKM